jgi:hypothetical protein
MSAAVRKQFGTGEPQGFNKFGATARRVAEAAKPYVILGAFSLVVSILIIAFLSKEIATWQSALIAGYLWDSTLQKIAGRP